jgi:hypothetical protein
MGELDSKWSEIKELLESNEDGLTHAARLNRLIEDYEEAKRNAPELCSTRRNSVFRRLEGEG